MSRKLVFLAVSLFLLVPVTDAQKRAFTIEDLYRIKHIDDMHLSVDGRLVVMAVVTDDLGKAKRTSHIWLMDAGGGSARQFTFADDNDSSPIFSPDSKWIAFVREVSGDD